MHITKGERRRGPGMMYECMAKIGEEGKGTGEIYEND